VLTFEHLRGKKNTFNHKGSQSKAQSNTKV